MISSRTSLVVNCPNLNDYLQVRSDKANKQGALVALEYLFASLGGQEQHLTICKIWHAVGLFKVARSGCCGADKHLQEERLQKLSDTITQAWLAIQAPDRSSFYTADDFFVAMQIIMRNDSKWFPATIPRALQELYYRYRPQNFLLEARVVEVTRFAGVVFMENKLTVTNRRYY